MVRIDYADLKKYKYPPHVIAGLQLFEDKIFDFITDSENGRHEKQYQCLQALTDAITKEIGYGGAAGGAKSWTGAEWLMWMSLAFPATRWFIGREELKRLRDSTLLTFYKVAKHHGVKKDVLFKYKSGNDHHIEFTNGSRIDLLELAELPRDPLFERYGSSEYTGGWFEEAGEIGLMAYDTLKSRCGRQHNDKYQILPKVYVTFNPKKNFVYTYFYRRDKEGSLPSSIKFIKALLYDNPFRDSEYEAQLISMSNVSQKERLLYGNFEYDDDPAQLCDYDAICDLFTNTHIKPGVKKMGVADLAMQGRDMFVAGYWEGQVGYTVINKEKSTGPEIETDCKNLCAKHAIPRSQFVYDSDGMGSYLAGYFENAKEFHGGAKPFREQYANLKTDCAYKLAEMINKRELYVVCHDEKIKQRIKDELGVLKSGDIDADTKKETIISKEDMKKLLTHSPDYLDWLIMRMYFEVAPKPATGYVSRG